MRNCQNKYLILHLNLMYLHLYLHCIFSYILSLSLSLFIYIFICTHACVHVSVHKHALKTFEGSGRLKSDWMENQEPQSYYARCENSLGKEGWRLQQILTKERATVCSQPLLENLNWGQLLQTCRLEQMFQLRLVLFRRWESSIPKMLVFITFMLMRLFPMIFFTFFIY